MYSVQVSTGELLRISYGTRYSALVYLSAHVSSPLLPYPACAFVFHLPLCSRDLCSPQPLSSALHIGDAAIVAAAAAGDNSAILVSSLSHLDPAAAPHASDG